MKKKYFILLILVGLAADSFANIQTTGWRWRNDNGDETTATWMAADTVPVTIGPNMVVRLRVRYDNPYGDGDYTVSGLMYAPKDTIDKLLTDYTGTDEFSVTGENAKWIPVGEFGYFDFVASEYVTDGAATTDQGIVYGSTYEADHQYDFSAGVFMSAAADYTLNRATFTEIEYCIKPTASCEGGTYYFLGGGGGNLIYPGAEKYEKYPELTVDPDYVGISNVKAQEIRVYASEGNIQLFSLPQGNLNISLYNVAGSKVKQLDTNCSGDVVTLSAANLAKGLYIVDVKSAEGTFRQKFVLN